MKLINAILIAWGLILAAATARAGPMGFEGSWMSMGDLGANWRDVWVNYALTPRDAIGGGYLYMRSDDKRTTRELAEVTYTRLVHRWNLPDAQANIWFVGGLGALRGGGFDGAKLAYTPGLQADMVCAFCAQGIEKKLRALNQTKEVYVNLKNKVVAVELKDGQALSPDAFTALIKDAGYDVVAVETVDKSAQQIKAEIVKK